MNYDKQIPVWLLLKHLVHGAGDHTGGFATMLGAATFNDKKAQDIIRLYDEGPGEKGVYRFDYVAGRPLKVTIDSKEGLIERADLYDRDAGRGACARAVEAAMEEFTRPSSSDAR